jgi:hypothetical protein
VASLKRESAAHRGDGGDAPTNFDQLGGAVDPANSACGGRPQVRTGERIDRRNILLLMAKLRFDLVERGEMSLDEAFSGTFMELLREVGQAPCWCECETLQRMESQHRKVQEQNLKDWRHKQLSRGFQGSRPAASTLDAYRYVVRTNDPERLRAWLERHPEVAAWLKGGR